MVRALWGFTVRRRTRAAVASVVVVSLVLIAPGVSAAEIEGGEPVEVSHQMVLVVDTTDEYVMLAPQLSWSVPEGDPDALPTGFEVRRTHQDSGEQVRFCVAGDVNGLLDSSVRYTDPETETELVEGNDYFIYEVRATRSAGADLLVTPWAAPLTVSVYGRPLSSTEAAADLPFDDAPAPSPCAEGDASSGSPAGGNAPGAGVADLQGSDQPQDPDPASGVVVRSAKGSDQRPDPDPAPGVGARSVQGSDHLKGSDQRPDPDPAPDPVVRSVQVVDPEDDEQPGTALQTLGIGPVCPRRNCPPDETLPICGDRPTEPCRMGNSTFTPPDDVPDIGQGDPGEIPWGDIPGHKFPWTSCWRGEEEPDGTVPVTCTR